MSTDPGTADTPALSFERHGYQPAKEGRLFGGAGTLAICSLIVIGFLAALNRYDHPKAVSAPLVVMQMPAAPRPEPAKPEPPKPKQKPPNKVEPREAVSPSRPILPVQAPTIPVSSAPTVPTVSKPQSKADAPTPQPAAPAAPPVQPQASQGPDKWEGRVLARLEQHRRYPADAERAHEQGTAFIRFRLDRDGHVLSASLDRSSGNAMLDAAALETLRRSDPFPKIPQDRPDEVELRVPIQFFLRQR